MRRKNYSRTLFLFFGTLWLLMASSVSFSEDKDELDVNFSLTKKLLVVSEKKGFLACAYIDVETCNKLNEACAIVSGVNDYDDMMKAKIIAVSKAASDLGVKVGDSGESAVRKFK